MTTVLLATENGLAIATHTESHWRGQIALAGHDCQSVTFDPHRSGRAYCGTYDAGLWVSDDGGETWQETAPLPSEHVMAVAVSPSTVHAGLGLLWAGTEPSRLFFSTDGGDSWSERPGLQEIPSRPTWRFPPRPWTHHVRWIEPDPNDPERLYVGIELGGVMRSLDRGVSWEDRKPGSQHDCHTLRTHPAAPGVLYEAAGGGFAKSQDGGESWRSSDDGMGHHYVYGLAVDWGDPHTLIASAAHGAGQAHSNGQARSHLYRRSGDEPWQEVSHGLPSPDGTRIYILAAEPETPGIFFAATGSRLFRSHDGGQSWESVPVEWPDGWSSRGANGLAVE